MKTVKIPTGFLFTVDGSKGQLEGLSIGDYGKARNIKADFLGHTREIHGVPNGPTVPLSEKWVITISTQYGCIQKCTFCDVPKIKFAGNASFDDLKMQYSTALSMFPNVRYTDRLNLHFARMGEPIYNPNVFEFAKYLMVNKHALQREWDLRIEVLHPVLTTSLPKFSHLGERVQEWCRIKNGLYNGQAGLQLSINSTDDAQRDKMFAGGSISLEEASVLGNSLPDPIGRKYCLNFAYSTDFIVDAQKLRSLFDPDKFMVKITPIHNCTSCVENGIETVGGYHSYLPYKQVEEEMKAAGFDVLVFVPSMDEEQGLVTCGNLAMKE
jgi:23S rRNA (adenine2503-C2)-methyltransferase